MRRSRRTLQSPLCSRPVVQPRRVDLDGFWSNLETGWCAFGQLAIRVDVPALPRPDLDLSTFKRPDIAPLAVRAQPKGREQRQQLPPVIDFQAVEMQQPVLQVR